VGAKNYRYFISAVVAITVEVSLLFILSLAYLIEVFVVPEALTSRIDVINQTYNDMPINNDAVKLPLDAIKAIVVVSTAIYFPLIAMIYQLAGFHFMLCKY
jgi:hypothetical protein